MKLLQIMMSYIFIYRILLLIIIKSTKQFIFPITGSDWLSRLSNLEFLDLQNNMFNNSILSSLGALSSLKGLYLSDNKLKGIVDVPGNYLSLALFFVSINFSHINDHL